VSGVFSLLNDLKLVGNAQDARSRIEPAKQLLLIDMD
jgi:hypothetical protein